MIITYAEYLILSQRKLREYESAGNYRMCAEVIRRMADMENIRRMHDIIFTYDTRAHSLGYIVPKKGRFQ